MSATSITPDDISKAYAWGVVGRRLDELRRARGLESAELAKASGVPSARVENLLRSQTGARPGQLQADVAALAAALGSTVDAVVRPPSYTTNELAEMVGLSAPTVADWCHKGRVASTRMSGPGRRYLVSAEEVARVLREPLSSPRGGKRASAPDGAIGRRIFTRMRDRGVNQFSLHESSGVPQSRLSMIIRGKQQPTAAQVEKLAVALGTDGPGLIGAELWAKLVAIRDARDTAQTMTAELRETAVAITPAA